MSCKTCKYFISYEDIYEDPLEPYDIGECHVENKYPISSELCGITWKDNCDKWEPKEKQCLVM